MSLVDKCVDCGHIVFKVIDKPENPDYKRDEIECMNCKTLYDYIPETGDIIYRPKIRFELEWESPKRN